MKYQFDHEFLISCFRDLVNTPSPVGYYVQMQPVIERYAAMFGHTVTYDERSTPYITLEGEDNAKTVMLGAHLDTVGYVVRRIDPDGMIRVRNVGGINYHSAEGETVTVHTRDGRSYTGLIACQSHSVHAFEDAHTSARDEKTMIVILDQPVKSKADVVALGIRHGDPISVEPRCEYTENGYLKSRFIDNKGAAACCFTMLKYLAENGLKPRYRTIISLPYNEEVGLGGTYIPPEVSEYIALDIGLIGPDCDGNEFAVSICAKDNCTPYDYGLTTRLIELAEKIGVNYAVDIFWRYGTDASASLRAGNNLKAAAFGMAVYCSHGRERTHITGLDHTTALATAYVLGE